MNTRAVERESRLVGRLLVFVWAVLFVGSTVAVAQPAKTMVQDTLYRADGSAAHGRLTIQWNGFSTSTGDAVPAGEMTVETDANGKLSFALIPNVGAVPDGSYYKVVIQLDDGSESQEQWIVPTTSPTTLAAMRAEVVPQATAIRYASMSELEAQVSSLARVATTGSYSDLTNQPAIPNMAAPGPIGGITPNSGAFTSVAASALNNTQFAGVGTNATIQAAVNALPASGGKVVIPTGVYKLSSEILVQTAAGGQYEICGEGPGTILSISGTNGGIHITGTAGSTGAQVKLCDMTITASQSSGIAAFGWHLDGVAHFTVQDVNVFGGNFQKGGWQTAAQQGEVHGGYYDPGTAPNNAGLWQEAGPQPGTNFPVASNGTEVHGVSFNGGTYCVYQSQVDDTEIHSNHMTSCAYMIYNAQGGYSVPNYYDNHMEAFTIAGIYSVNSAFRAHENNFLVKGTGASGPMDIVCPGGCDIRHNLIQAGIDITGTGVQNSQIVGNQFNLYATVTDNASDTYYSLNYGQGAGSLPGAYIKQKNFAIISAANAASDITNFNPNSGISGPWGISIAGAGPNQDIYLRLGDVTWNGSTSTGSMTLKSGIGGNTWAQFNGNNAQFNTAVTINHGNSGEGLSVTGTGSTAGPIATFSPGGSVAMPTGIQVNGAGSAQDVYVQLHDVTLNGMTSGGGLTIKSGVGGTTWATFNSQGMTLNTGKLNAVPANAGVATLSAGAATVTTTAACAPGANCVYKLTRCGANSSTAIGELSVGAVTSGASFVINSLSQAVAVVTGDISSVCWQIN